MAARSVKDVVRDNVLALLTHVGGPLPAGQSGVTRLKNMGVAQGTAQRVLGGETSIGIDVLQQIAELFKLEPWQLLVPGLDPARVPGLTADTRAWPLPMVDRAAFYELGADDRAYVQGVLDEAISKRRSVATKPPATAEEWKREIAAEVAKRRQLIGRTKPPAPSPSRS